MEQFEQLLTCCVCLDRYRNPKLLPCQHSFCMEPCMEGLTDYVRKQVKCPECRAEHRVPYQGIQAFPTNVTLQRFLELHIDITGELPDPTAGQIMERCGVCSEKQYLQPCAHCEKKICEDCKSAHMDILRREITRINSQIRRSIHRLQDALSIIEKNTVNLQTNCFSVTEELDEIYRRVTKTIKDRTDELRSQVELYLSAELRKLRTLKSNLELEIGNIVSNCDLGEKHMNENVDWDDCELMDTKEIFLKTVEFLRNFEYESNESSKRIRFFMNKDPNQLVKDIAILGELSFPQSIAQTSNHLAPPSIQAGLSRSKSDHRLTQFRSNDDRGYDDEPVLGGRKFGERPIKNSGSDYDTGSSRYGRSGRGDDYDYDEPTTRTKRNFRSRFVKSHQNDDISDSEHSRGTRGGGNSGQDSFKNGERVIDTEDVSRGQLSGIIRLQDCSRVIKRLQESGKGKKEKKTEKPTVTPAAQPAVRPKPAAPAAARQVSQEDEISRIKRQNKETTSSTVTEARQQPIVETERPTSDRVTALRQQQRTTAQSTSEESDSSAQPTHQTSVQTARKSPAVESKPPPVPTSGTTSSTTAGSNSAAAKAKVSRTTSTESSESTESSSSNAASTTTVPSTVTTNRTPTTNSTAAQQNRTTQKSTTQNTTTPTTGGQTTTEKKPFQSRFLPNHSTAVTNNTSSKKPESESSSETETSSDEESEEEIEATKKPTTTTTSATGSRTGGSSNTTTTATPSSTNSYSSNRNTGSSSTTSGSGITNDRPIADSISSSRRSSRDDTNARTSAYSTPSTYTPRTRPVPAPHHEPESDRYSSTTGSSYTSRFLNRSKSSAVIPPSLNTSIEDDATGDDSDSRYGTGRSRYLAMKERRSRLARSRSSHALGVDDDDLDDPPVSPTTASPSAYLASRDLKWVKNAHPDNYIPNLNKKKEMLLGYGPSSYSTENSALSRSRSSHALKSRESSPASSVTDRGAASGTAKDGEALSSWARYLKNKYGNRRESARDVLASTTTAAPSSHTTPSSMSSASRRLSLGLPLRQANEYGSSDDDGSKNGLGSPTSPTVAAGITGLAGISPKTLYLRKRQQLFQLGGRGSEPGSFTWPRGIAVGPDNSIVVADSSNHRVQVFDSNGIFVKEFGEYGNSEGEFDCLAGVAVNRIGQYIIADRYNHRIQVLDPQGRFLRAFGSQGTADGKFSYPWGVTTDSLGFIYVCDKENHRVQVFQSDGTFVGKFGTCGREEGQLEHPHYIAVSNTNRVIVSDSNNHRIQIFDVNGKVLSTFGGEGSDEGQFKFPRGVAVDDQGYICVADSGNNRIQIFNPDGSFLKAFGSWGSGDCEFKGLEGVAIMSNGNILVCDRENHRVQVF
ncbi:RING finger protein nhl-1 isoform X2 [Condylostylus longicornis]|uniref:RING finger protein nhl-1 isoform X2 n=1 Tax=Condylostylus longicornis TaxID=2530218 RepID=UPI00244DF2C9|nr:RING finger protein nhl-1 isoform X2 [Condylostylus longicornis]